MNRVLNHRRLALAGLAGVMVMLTACSKPPSCADEKTTQTIRNMLQDNAQKSLTSWGGAAMQDDPQKIQDAYYQALKTEITNVVSDGYNSEAKKYTCRANLSVTTPSGQNFAHDISYTTQLTEGNGGFMVEVQELPHYVKAVSEDLFKHYRVKRYAGEWSGEYRCAGISGATEGPAGPFSQAVVAQFNGSTSAPEARFKRPTALGGQGNVVITIPSLGNDVMVFGDNVDPSNAWNPNMTGKIQGTELVAKGETTSPDRRDARQCSLNLKQSIK